MSLRPWVFAFAVVMAVAVGVAPAEARRNRSFGASNYSANGTFGLGLELGSPFGLNGKYFVTPSNALNFGIGADGYYRGRRDGLHLYLDYLWHPFNIASVPAFQLPLYIGIGGRVWDFDDDEFDDDGLAFGVRLPVGVSFDLNKLPLDFFIQLTFVLDFYTRYDNDDVGANILGSVGFRFWF